MAYIREMIRHNVIIDFNNRELINTDSGNRVAYEVIINGITKAGFTLKNVPNLDKYIDFKNSGVSVRKK